MTSLTSMSFGVIALVCGIIGISSVGAIGLALASSDSDNESEEDSSTVAEEECFLGPSAWQKMLSNPEIEESSRITFQENYEDSLRTEEIKTYIVENKDDLGVPDYFDADLILCGIAGDVQEKEKATGIEFTDEELDTNIKLSLMSRMGDAASKLFENPEQYLTP